MAPRQDRWARYVLPASVSQDALAFGGEWRVGAQQAIAGRGAELRLHFHAQDVYLVMSGRGHVRLTVNGVYVRTVRVAANRLYTLLRLPQLTDATLDLAFSRGVGAYAFTFG
jgi:hypothetical protein